MINIATDFGRQDPTRSASAESRIVYAALYAVQGILLAHISRSLSGKGQFVDVALLDFGGLGARPARWHCCRDRAESALAGSATNTRRSRPPEPPPASDGDVICCIGQPWFIVTVMRPPGCGSTPARSSVFHRQSAADEQDAPIERDDPRAVSQTRPWTL